MLVSLLSGTSCGLLAKIAISCLAAVRGLPVSGADWARAVHAADSLDEAVCVAAVELAAAIALSLEPAEEPARPRIVNGVLIRPPRGDRPSPPSARRPGSPAAPGRLGALAQH